MKHPPEELPPRLIAGGATGESDGASAMLLKKFERQALQLAPEEAVWNRTLARLMREGRRHRLRLVFATACGVLLGAAGTWASLVIRAPSATTAVRSHPDPAAREAGVTRSAPAVAAQPAASVRGEAGEATKSGARNVPPAVGQPSPIPSPREAGRRSGRGTGAPTASEPSTETPRLRLSAIATALPRGPSELLDEAEVVLSAEGTAWATAEPQAAVVELEAGHISLHVEKRSPDGGRRFDVRAGQYRFTVLGTRFEVARREGGVHLSVSEGRVGVFRGETALTIVTAGGEWSSEAAGAATSAAPATMAMTSPSASAATQPPSPAPPTTAPPPIEPPALPAPPLPQPPAATSPSPPPASSPAMARPVPGSSCRPGARGDVRQLLTCYLNEARGTGLTAEVALYEAARLRRDNLTDLPGALQLLREHRRRFPTGTLTYEVRLSLAELLPRLARYREALTDIDWLLDAQPGPDRRGELLLLRGHVLREGMQNWVGAERAYAQAAEARGGDGRAADPASFWRAVCLESLGRKDEARRAYAAYLTRPHPSLREQAELRLRALEREHSAPTGAQSR